MNIFRTAAAIAIAGILSLSGAEANRNSGGGRGSRMSSGKSDGASRSVSGRHRSRVTKARIETRHRNASAGKKSRESARAQKEKMDVNDSAELPRRDIDDDNDVQNDEIGSGNLMGTAVNTDENDGGGH
jgi:hypothetical protein